MWARCVEPYGLRRLVKGRAEGGAGFGLEVSAFDLGRVYFWGIGLTQNVNDEGRGEPYVSLVAGAAGGLFRFETAVFMVHAPVFEALAAFVIPVHEGRGFDTHA